MYGGQGLRIVAGSRAWSYFYVEGVSLLLSLLLYLLVVRSYHILHFHDVLLHLLCILLFYCRYFSFNLVLIKLLLSQGSIGNTLSLPIKVGLRSAYITPHPDPTCGIILHTYFVCIKVVHEVSNPKKEKHSVISCHLRKFWCTITWYPY